MAWKSESSLPVQVISPPPIQKILRPHGSFIGWIELEYTRRPRRVSLIPLISSVRSELTSRKAAYEMNLAENLAKPSERLDAWQLQSEALAMDLVEHRRKERRKVIAAVRSDTAKLIESMHLEGDPLVRVLAVLVSPTHR